MSLHRQMSLSLSARPAPPTHLSAPMRQCCGLLAPQAPGRGPGHSYHHYQNECTKVYKTNTDTTVT